MKQILMSLLRCVAFTRSGMRCPYRAKYGNSNPFSCHRWCGHHRPDRRRS